MASYQVLISPLFNGPITRLLAFEVDRYNDEVCTWFCVGVIDFVKFYGACWYFICILASWFWPTRSHHLYIIPFRRNRLEYMSFAGVGWLLLLATGIFWLSCSYSLLVLMLGN